MSNSIKGLTVEINGNTQPLTNAINQLDNPLKASKNELKQIDRLLKMDPHNTELLAQRQQVLAQAVQQAKAKLDALKTAEQQAQAQFARGDIGEEQMRALSRAVIAAENDLKKLENQGKDAGQEVKEGGEEGKKGLDKTSEAAEKAENKLQGLKNAGKIVGSAIAAGFIAAGAAGYKLVKDLAGMTTDAAAYADTILTEAKVTGISTEQLQAYHYAAEQIDTSLETVTRSQTRNLKSMQSAAKGTGDVAEAYKELGVDALDPVTGKMRDANTVYWETIDALGKIEDDTKRDSLAMTLLGKSAKELNPLIKAGSARLAELTEEAHSMGAVLSEETLQELGHLDDSVQQLKSGGTALKNQLGTVLRPELQGFVDGLNDLLGRMTTGIEEADGDWDKISEIIAEGVDEAAGMLAEFIPRIIETVGNGILAIADAILEKAPELLAAFEKVAEKALELAPKFVETAVQLIQKLVKGIGQNAGKIVAAGNSIVISLLKGVKQLAPDVIKAATSLVTEFIKSIPELLPQVLELGAEIAVSLATGIAGSALEVTAAVVKLFVPFEEEADKARQKAEEVAASVTPFAKALENAVATANPAKLRDAYGRTAGDISAIIDENEQAIYDILKERLENQEELRQEDLDNIRNYLDEIERLESSKLGIFQSAQEAERKKAELDTDMDEDSTARHLIGSATALDNTLKAIEDLYSNRLTTIENLHKQGVDGYATDEEYNTALQAALDWYEDAITGAEGTYSQTLQSMAIALSNSAKDSISAYKTIGETEEKYRTDEGTLNPYGGILEIMTHLGLWDYDSSDYVDDLANANIDLLNTYLTTLAIQKQETGNVSLSSISDINDIMSAFTRFAYVWDDDAKPILDALVSGLEKYIPDLKNLDDTDDIVDAVIDYFEIAEYISGQKSINVPPAGGRGGGAPSPDDVKRAPMMTAATELLAQYMKDENAPVIDAMNDTAEATKTGNRTLDSILAAVNGLNLTLVLDDGTVIARTIGRIDAGLGDRAKNDKRGSFD